jgi:hypothetical protein
MLRNANYMTIGQHKMADDGVLAAASFMIVVNMMLATVNQEKNAFNAVSGFTM